MLTMEPRAQSSASVHPGVLALAIFFVALWADVTLKTLAQEALADPVRIADWVYLAVQRNDGIFLGALPVANVAVVHWLVVCTAMVWFFWRLATARSLSVSAGYALVAAGLMGNMFGRIKGEVIDYLGFGPIVDGQWLFVNFADICLVAGAILLGAVLLRSRAQRCPASLADRA